MLVLITGGAGQLGSELVKHCPPQVGLVVTKRSAEPPGNVRAVPVELSDPVAVSGLLSDVEPDVVIHTAYSHKDLSADVVAATTNVAAAARSVGARMIHMSTDALFSGLNPPYRTGDPPSPIHAYGEAKAQAEEVVRAICPGAVIVRTSLICSYRPPYGANGWIVDALSKGEKVSLFENEIRFPIMVSDLAKQIWDLALADPDRAEGIWHLIGPVAMSRVEVGRAHCAALGLDPNLIESAMSDPLQRPTDLTLIRSVSPLLSSEPADIATVGPHG